LDGSQWLKSFQFSNKNPNPTTVIEPPVSLRLASTSFHSLSTISTLYLSVFPNGSHGGPSHRCTHAPRSHTAASRGSSLVPSLSLGSDEEGTWCRSSEVMWCGSSEEGRVVVNPARRARGDGLSLGSDKEGVWCTSSEEVTWCGSGEEGMWW
jgi:hypothetical protein